MTAYLSQGESGVDPHYFQNLTGYICDKMFMITLSGDISQIVENVLSHNVEESGGGWLPKFNQFFCVHRYNTSVVKFL